MNEKWVDIEGYEGYYQVSNLGRVMRLSRVINTGATIKNLILSPNVSKVGYQRVALSSPLDGRVKHHSVHRLVAKAFVSGYAPDLVVNHKDENKLNNVASNLEWTTPKANTNHGTAIKRRAEKKRKPVLQVDLNGVVIAEYASIREAELATGIDHRRICKCLKGHAHTAAGYYWVYTSPQKVEKVQTICEPPVPAFEDLENEEWRQVVIDTEVYPSYEISNKGRIRIVPRRGQSKNYKLCHPYYVRGRAQIALRKNGKKFKTSVARIVAFAFCSGYQPGYQANHIDENPLNDCASNLEWVSCQDNINYGDRTARVMAKLSKPVAQMDDDGNVIRVFDTISQACEEVGGRIKEVCDGKRTHAKGYCWKWL